MKVVAIVSGGLDSVVLAHMLARNGALDCTLTFDYGQKHVREIDFAHRAALRLNVPHRILVMTHLASMLPSALTSPEVQVPDGHYADETMRLTVVPNRNSIMLSIAVGYAIGRKANAVALAVHAGDHAIYPDCRPEFIAAFQKTMRIANEGFCDPGFEVLAPFVNKSKADIVRLGLEIGVRFDETWSCYKGGDVHCGRCGTCVERREAFALTQITDPTVYEEGVPA